jgi:beta-mannanase
VQPAYSLKRIIAGDFDNYIASFADQIRTWNGHLGLRFIHELNAPYYPWGAGVNKNSPADAINAWKHVREVFIRMGATNITWIWSANIHADGTIPFKSVFPGDDWVDLIGLDGYNGGSALPWGGWRDPEQLFGPSIDDLSQLSQRPLALTEVGCVEEGGDKANWIKQLFAMAVARRLRLVIWFQYDKEADWRFDSTPASANAFRNAVSGL